MPIEQILTPRPRRATQYACSVKLRPPRPRRATQYACSVKLRQNRTEKILLSKTLNLGPIMEKSIKI
jgi:hypothetical protein